MTISNTICRRQEFFPIDLTEPSLQKLLKVHAVSEMISNLTRTRHQWYTLILPSYNPWGQSPIHYPQMSCRHSSFIPKHYCQSHLIHVDPRLVNSSTRLVYASNRDYNPECWKNYMPHSNRIIQKHWKRWYCTQCHLKHGLSFVFDWFCVYEKWCSIKFCVALVWLLQKKTGRGPKQKFGCLHIWICIENSNERRQN